MYGKRSSKMGFSVSTVARRVTTSQTIYWVRRRAMPRQVLPALVRMLEVTTSERLHKTVGRRNQTLLLITVCDGISVSPTTTRKTGSRLLSQVCSPQYFPTHQRGGCFQVIKVCPQPSPK